MEIIKWNPIIERHCLGKTEIGDVWIRLNRDNKVVGLYTMWGETKKFVPNNEEEETIDDMKILAEILLEHKLEEIKKHKK